MIKQRDKLREAVWPVRKSVEREFLSDDKGYRYTYARKHSIRIAHEITSTTSPGYPNYHKEKEMACVVALLHDVPEMVEEVSVDSLRKRYESIKEFSDYFSRDEIDEIFLALSCITRGKIEDSSDYMRRLQENRLAAIVKVYDITDNLRACFRTGTRKGLVERYTKALRTLSDSLITEGQACVDIGNGD